jgi:hypothetical protein
MSVRDVHAAWLQLRDGRPQHLQAECDRVDAAIEAAIEAAIQSIGQEGAELKLELQRACAGLQQRCAALTAQTEAALRERDDATTAAAHAAAALARHEAGHAGLATACAEVRQLAAALAARDADVARLTVHARVQWERYDLLLDALRRFAPPGVDDVFEIFPLPQLQASVCSTWEALRAANAELARQNEALEAQRWQLLQRLRARAETTPARRGSPSSRGTASATSPSRASRTRPRSRTAP